MHIRRGLLAGSACSLRSAAPLADNLALEFERARLQTGVSSTLTVALRNVGSEPVEICLVDSGVSVWLTRETGEMIPLLMHGPVRDARCERSVRLQPGGAVEFQERVAVPHEWRSGRGITLTGLIRVKRLGEQNSIGQKVVEIRTPKTGMPLDAP